MIKSVTIYTTNTCAYCVMVEKYLDMKELKYQLVNLDDEPERQAEALALSGALAVPVTVFTKDNGAREVVVGYNLQKLAAATA